MANSRDPNQTLVAFPLDKRFLATIDRVRGRDSRSAFIRDALAKYLAEKNHPVARELVEAADRAGKGGRPKKQPTKKASNP